MLIPISCDAPVYHWPFATVGIIIANVAVHAAIIVRLINDPAAAEELVMSLALVHGEGIFPLQWVTSIFVHDGLLHLLGNMLFLWVFGLVVEGKLGWRRFLIVYLVIGILQSALEQTLSLTVASPGASVGASSAIYGIMAIALVWAPKNEINCFYWFGLWLAGTADVPIVMFTLIYLAFDLLGIALTFGFTGNAMSSGVLHFMGAAIGAPLGVLLLQRKVVDCEGWDALSLYRGHGSPAEKNEAELDAKIRQRKLQQKQQQLEDARRQIDVSLSRNDAVAAKVYYDKARQSGEVVLSQKQLLQLIRGLHANGQWVDSAPLMAEFIERFPTASDGARIKLAHICVAELQRPARAMELLHAVDYSQQPKNHVALANKIAKKARQLQEEGVYELDDDQW